MVAVGGTPKPEDDRRQLAQQGKCAERPLERVLEWDHIDDAPNDPYLPVVRARAQSRSSRLLSLPPRPLPAASKVPR
jgi:hypothetical protein